MKEFLPDDLHIVDMRGRKNRKLFLSLDTGYFFSSVSNENNCFPKTCHLFCFVARPYLMLSYKINSNKYYLQSQAISMAIADNKPCCCR